MEEEKKQKDKKNNKYTFKVLCMAGMLIVIAINCCVIGVTVQKQKNITTDALNAANVIETSSLSAELNGDKKDEIISEPMEEVFDIDENSVSVDDIQECVISENDLSSNEAIDYSQFRPDDWRLILVNKQHPIPEDYDPKLGTVSTPRGKMRCDRRMIPDLNKMFEAASEEGITLLICSPYRPSNRQDYLFNKKVKNYIKKGSSYMDAYYQTAQAVTIPGASEHEMGLALDIISNKYSGLNEGFGESDAGLWLAEHCVDYGFIIRYPLGKENITGIEYEPWHIRYVGTKAAKVMKEENLCLEEFVDLIKE